MDEDDIVDDVASGAASRSVFQPAHTVRRIYTGNTRCQLCPGEALLASVSLDTVNFVDLTTGRVVKRIVLVS
jgi:hypothetical protein